MAGSTCQDDILICTKCFYYIYFLYNSFSFHFTVAVSLTTVSYGSSFSIEMFWKWLIEAEAGLWDHWTQRRSVNSASQNNFWNEMKIKDWCYMTAYQRFFFLLKLWCYPPTCWARVTSGLLWFIAWNNYCNWHCKSHCNTGWFSVCCSSSWENIFRVRIGLAWNFK